MNKIDYLKQCVQEVTPLAHKAWYIYMLGIPTYQSGKGWQDLPHLTPYPQEDGMYIVQRSDNETDAQLTKLQGVKITEPIFGIQDLVEIDATWLPSVPGPITTKLGNLIINTVAIHASLGTKLPYLNEPISVKKLENQIASLLADEEDMDPTKISVSEYTDCMDRLWFFTRIATLVNYASTPKLITAAPGVKDLRKQLIQKYKDQLTDPAVVATVTDALVAHDKEYLKDDIVFNKSLSGKEMTARKKLYQIYGETNDFDAGIGSDPILGSMDEGLSTSDKDLPKYMNDLRYASYSRGSSTQLSGYTYKILQRSIAGITVVDEDCGTRQGFTRLITERNHSKLLSRYVKLSEQDKDWILVDSADQSKSYLGKRLVVRSPMRCLSPVPTLCYRCLGESFKGSASAMTNLAAAMSGEFMTLFLKRMHTSGFSLTTLEKKDLVT